MMMDGFSKDALKRWCDANDGRFEVREPERRGSLTEAACVLSEKQNRAGIHPTSQVVMTEESAGFKDGDDVLEVTAYKMEYENGEEKEETKASFNPSGRSWFGEEIMASGWSDEMSFTVTRDLGGGDAESVYISIHKKNPGNLVIPPEEPEEEEEEEETYPELPCPDGEATAEVFFDDDEIEGEITDYECGEDFTGFTVDTDRGETWEVTGSPKGDRPVVASDGLDEKEVESWMFAGRRRVSNY